MTSTGSPQTRAPGIGGAISVRRFANDEIARVGSSLDDLDETHRFEFLCECGDLACRKFVGLTVKEYHALSPGFVLGHPVSDAFRLPPMSSRPMPDAATLAAANDHILLHVRDSDDGQEWEFLCECGNENCHQRVLLTIDSYIELHDAGPAILAPGHKLDPVTRSKTTRQEAQALRAEAQQTRRSGRRRLRKA